MRKAFTPKKRAVWTSFAAALAGGSALGVLAKLADQSTITGLGDLGTYFGLWIFAATLVAAWSRTAALAALQVGLLMLGMVAAYYLTARALFGVFPASYFRLWATAAVVLSPLFALLVWPSRRLGWWPALAAALPVGLLLAEAYGFRWVLPLHLTPFVFDVAAAAALLAVLPRGGAQRLRVLALTPLVFLGARGLERFLPYLLGFLQGATH